MMACQKEVWSTTLGFMAERRLANRATADTQSTVNDFEDGQ